MGPSQTLSFETGRLAQQSQGAVVAQIGDTVVLATANAAAGVREGIDFFPLTVDVEERMYAAGKIPGSFFRREGRPSDTAILTARLIDRPLRPSFADGYRNETQVVITVLGADQENPHDVLAINAASAALMLSGIPFEGPIGAVRIAYTAEGQWLPHPTYQEGDDVRLRAGRRRSATRRRRRRHHDGRGRRHRGRLGAVPGRRPEGDRRGHRRGPRGRRRPGSARASTCSASWSPRPAATPRSPTCPRSTTATTWPSGLPRSAPTRVDKVTTITAKAEREAATDEATAAIVAELSGEFEGREKEIKAAVRSLIKQLVRQRIATTGVRIDGRGPTDIRPAVG